METNLNSGHYFENAAREKRKRSSQNKRGASGATADPHLSAFDLDHLNQGQQRLSCSKSEFDVSLLVKSIRDLCLCVAQFSVFTDTCCCVITPAL